MGRVLVQQHEFNDIGRCSHCGMLEWARVVEQYRRAGKNLDSGATDTRRCVERLFEKLRPEPARRPLACEDADTIGAAIETIRVRAAEAEVAISCAVMHGMTRAQCSQCTAGGVCKVCALRKSLPVSSCLYCYVPGAAAKPCP